MRFLNYVLLLTMCVHAASYASTLELLFESGDYEAFLPNAEVAAAADDIDGLFLLGKAYHLGKGVPEDARKASAYYQRARDLGSARASHNLATIAEAQRDIPQAERLYEEALERGLKMPTLLNLAHMTYPDEGGKITSIPYFVEKVGRSGDYYAQAYAENNDDETLAFAAKAYVRAAVEARKYPSSHFDADALSARAVEWLKRSMSRGDNAAWTNYGVLLMEEENYAEARAALLVGAENNESVAHYYLARMPSEGESHDEHARREIYHYEQAALLGLKEAAQLAIDRLGHSLRRENDLATLESGVRRLERLYEVSDFPATYALKDAISRLEWVRKLHAKENKAKPQVGLPMVLQACGLGWGEVYGDTFNLGINTSWRLVAHQMSGTEQRLLEGRVGKDGCASSAEALAPMAQALLADGAVFALHFPNYSLPLKAEENEGQVVLSLEPQVMPIPR